jgi:hypothetical protein
MFLHSYVHVYLPSILPHPRLSSPPRLVAASLATGCLRGPPCLWVASLVTGWRLRGPDLPMGGLARDRTAPWPILVDDWMAPWPVHQVGDR